MLLFWGVYFLYFNFLLHCCASTNIFSDSYPLVQNGSIHRQIRQTSCRKNEKQCSSGECLPSSDFCDGAINCKDGSDETIERCAKMKCPPFSFICAYGACVDGDAKCNNVQDCADNSDEQCETLGNSTDRNSQGNLCPQGTWACVSGQCIDKYSVCDGINDCNDNSDETHLQCSQLKCPRHFFQCLYGACVDGDASCNGVNDCADGSDERDCDSNVPVKPGTIQVGCVLPPIPSNGMYTYNDHTNFRPGQIVSGISKLDFSCRPGFKLNSIVSDVFCNKKNNKWNRPIPKCLRTCPPRISNTVDIKCVYKDLAVNCSEPMLPDTLAYVNCKDGYEFGALGIPSPYNLLKCLDGTWDEALVKCTPVCGKKNAKFKPTVIGGAIATTGEYPWHVGIYSVFTIRDKRRYSQICGGSLVNAKLVITAAHCFDGSRDPSLYAIGAGKVHRNWDDPEDAKTEQKSNITEILIPLLYNSVTNNFQHDISLLVLETYIVFNKIVLPICIDLENKYEQNVLQKGNQGTVVGWGLTAEGGMNSPVLKELNMTYVTNEECITKVDISFRPIVYIPDKFCAGDLNGDNVCEGDSGGGLVFPRQGTDLYFIRGIVSLSPDNGRGSCDSSQYSTFTKISYHLNWLTKTIKDNVV